MKRGFSIAVLLAAFSGQASAANLMQIYDMAVGSDPQLQAARSSRDSMAENYNISRSQLLPQINVSGDFTRSESERRGSVRETYNTGQAAISLKQALLRFDRWIQLGVAKSNTAGADAQYRAERINLMLRVAEAYFNILGAKDTLHAAKANVTAIGRQLEQARQRFDVGLIAVTDVHQAQAAYDQARAEKISAAAAVDSAWEALWEIVGPFPDHSLAGLRAKIPMRSPKPSSIEQWTQRALMQSPEILAAKKSTDAARENIDLQRSGHLPTLDLVASGSTRDTDANIYSSDFDDASIGVELTLPVFSGGATSAQTRQARHDFSTAAEKQEQVRRAVRREVRDAYRGVDASISKVKALEAATRSAASSLKATRAGFDVGTRTLVDVLDEQRNLLQAERDLALERYNYLLNGLRLKKAAGILSVDDLQMVNALLTRR